MRTFEWSVSKKIGKPCMQSHSTSWVGTGRTIETSWNINFISLHTTNCQVWSFQIGRWGQHIESVVARWENSSSIAASNGTRLRCFITVFLLISTDFKWYVWKTKCLALAAFHDNIVGQFHCTVPLGIPEYASSWKKRCCSSLFFRNDWSTALDVLLALPESLWRFVWHWKADRKDRKT